MSGDIQEAVRLIVRLYREPDLLRRLRETPEQLDRLLEAMVEIARGEEGEVAREIAEASARHEVDAKSVVDGANFLLSLLHAGPEGSPYRVLGLERGASQEAIKRRWRLLMQIYHPDRHPDRPEWVTERAKQINEAYALLRNEEEKQRLDAELSPAPQAGPAGPAQAATRTDRPRAGMPWSARLSPALRKRLPRLVMASLLGGAAIIVAIVYLANYPAPTDVGVKVAKKEVRSEKSEVRSEKSEVKSEKSTIHPHPNPLLSKEREETGSQGSPLPSREREGVRVQEVKSEVRSEKLEVRSQESADRPHGTLLSLRVVRKEAPREEKKERLPAGKAGTFSPEPVKTPARLKESSLRPAGGVAAAPAAPLDPPKEPPLLQPLPVRQAGARVEKEIPALPAGREVVSAPPPSIAIGAPKVVRIAPEEVHRFLAEYTAAFERGDIGRFMALFSRSAIENGSRSYEEIRGAYAASFAGKEKTRYLVKDVEIVPSEQEAVVRGRFEIAQQRKQDGRRLEAQGAIRWRLIREGEQIKVATVDYVRQ